MIKSELKVGDYVEVVFGKCSYKGILLESPEDEKGLILLKLDSGYNVGFVKKETLGIQLLKSGDSKKEEPSKIKKDSGKPNIAMIITGGTIAARLNPKKGGVDWLTSTEDLFKFYPDLFEIANVSRVEVPFMKASEDMDFKDWQKLAKILEKFLNDGNIKGVIITHGTDFLHYTAAALSFFIKDLNKPIVLTYSQRSIDRASSDANLNLRCAAVAAISDIAEVMLVGHANSEDEFCYAMPGTKVRKMHTSRRDAFKIVNSGPFAKVYPDKIELISSEYNLRNEKKKPKSDVKFEEKIALVKFFPGQDPDILDYYVKNKYKGIVLEIAGIGHVATNRARLGWTKKLKEVQDKGLIVCVAPQTIFGRLDLLVYSNGRELLATGVIPLGDMLSETAFVKLGWVLGHPEWAKDKENVKKKMLENFAHELNPRLEE